MKVKFQKLKFNKKVIARIAIAVAAVCMIFALFWEEPSTWENYRTFNQHFMAGELERVEFHDDELYYQLVGDSSLYRTTNPSSTSLKEMLLLSDVEVIDAVEAAEVYDFVLNLMFDAMFFGFIGFGVYKLVSYDRSTFKVVRKTGVSFADIAGMDALKREMRQVVEILKDPSKRATAGVRQIKGVVLEGAPGNGKTFFAKALAQEAGVNFIATKGADFQSAFMSLGARKIRMLFKKAARHRPCIVFIDEFDSIGERRNYSGTGIDKENNRIITAMLNEMDGFTSKDGILVVAATNSYRSLDPALIRPGRFDLKFAVANPDLATRRELVRLYSKNKVMSSELAPETSASLFEGLSCSAIESVINEASMLAMLESAPVITLDHVVKAADRAGVALKI